MGWTVVFDLDDTLVPEADFVRSGRRAVAAHLESHYGVSDALEVLEQAAIEQPRRCFDVALAALGLDVTPVSVSELVDVYREHRPTDLSVYPDARRLLDALAGRANLAMVTDGWQSSQFAKLDALGIRGLFQPIICTFDRGREWHKPSTLAFEEIQEHYDSRGNECVYIGDNGSKDFGGPAALGWTTVLIRRPTGVHRSAPLATHRIDHQLDSLDQLGGRLPLLDSRSAPAAASGDDD